jgi:hypothetical protein
MHQFLVFSHSSLRWFYLGLGLYIIIKSYVGFKQKKGYLASDNLLSLVFMIIADIQLLIGLVMYFATSNLIESFKSDMGAAMKDAVMRYWVVEHLFSMVIAIALIHIGRTLSKKAVSDESKFKKQFIYFSLSMLIVLVNIPWPIRQLGIARELIPHF